MVIGSRGLRLSGWGLLILLCSSLSLQAGTIYSNFGGPFSTTNYSLGSSAAISFGIQFTATGSGHLATVAVPLAVNGSGVLTEGLFADSSGQPGVLIESWPGSDIPSIPPGNVQAQTLDSVQQPFLSAGSVYWFVVSDTNSSSIIWLGSTQPIAGGAWEVPGSGPFINVSASSPPPAIDLQATPEPRTSALIAGVFLVFCGSRMRSVLPHGAPACIRARR